MFFDDFNDDELGTQQGGLLSSAPDASGLAAGGTGTAVMDLIYATENERNCPTILPYPTALMDRVTALVAHHLHQADEIEQEEQRVAKESTEVLSLLPFRPAGIMQADLQRVKFFLSELLRTRLAKIEKLCSTIAHEGTSDDFSIDGNVPLTPPSGGDGAGLRSALSANEIMLAEQLAALQKQCIYQGGLHLLPEPLQHLTPNPPHGEGPEILPSPNTSAYVFVLALVDLGVVSLDVDVEQEIRAGEIFLVPYKALAPFVVEGKARLV